ncbi:NAD-dependent epimerase/dehydratase family protein [Histidinibacterium lentulum]
MTTWLLLGATGRVGRMLRRHWAGAPPEGVHLVAQSRRAGEGCLEWDPLDPDPPVRADVVLAFAGVVPAPGADLSLNVALGRGAVETARRIGARRVLLASSSAVYGPGRAVAETAPCRPVNAYGAAKLEMEEAVAGAEVETVCLRIGNVAWADSLLGGMAPGREVLLDRFTDGGGPMRSYIGPRELARVLESLARAEAPLPPLLNVAAPEPVAMEALLEAAGAAWRWQEAPASAVQWVTLDCARLAAVHRFTGGEGSAMALIAEGEGVKDAP